MPGVRPVSVTVWDVTSVLSTAVAVQAVVPVTRYSDLTRRGPVGGPGDRRAGVCWARRSGSTMAGGLRKVFDSSPRGGVHVARLVHGGNRDGVRPVGQAGQGDGGAGRGGRVGPAIHFVFVAQVRRWRSGCPCPSL